MNSWLHKVLWALFICSAALLIKTYLDLESFSDLSRLQFDVKTTQVVDRNLAPLSVSYQNQWNTYEIVSLSEIPELLQQAFVISEDQHFFEHGGVDWNARFMALWQALRFQKVHRGASTISEQVVRILHPRPRTLWSKWLETVEVYSLEAQFSKQQIIEFYLNQLPYASNRRGVLQAARYYFNRDLSTLSMKEMLALVVLARAPSRYDLYKDASSIEGSVKRLHERLCETIESASECPMLSAEKLQLSPPRDLVNASHFIRFVRANYLSGKDKTVVRTTLDSNLQNSVQKIIDQRMKALQAKAVHNAGAIVVDHQSGEILAWVVAGANLQSEDLSIPSKEIDAVIAKRQPASTLKPFLYALALDLGWTAATKIADTPLADVIGEGYHQFQNYSHSFRGDITLRNALGNSLNIPALRTIKFTGVGPFYNKLHSLGLESLSREKEFYDEGLALGNGEISLFELARAYAALANMGKYRDLHFLLGSEESVDERQVFSKESASIIGNILSDPKARQMEFGVSSVLNLPVQTAIKTGTSNDYHDAWAVGYNYRYVVGVWMGNLDRTRTEGVTGGIGPSLALRSIFGELTRNEVTKPLYLSPSLVKREICVDNSEQPCQTYVEYFASNTSELSLTKEKEKVVPRLVLPVEGMQVAIDPRVDRKYQLLPMKIEQLQTGDIVEWKMNGVVLARGKQDQYSWPLVEGKQRLEVSVMRPNNKKELLARVDFTVK